MFLQRYIFKNSNFGGAKFTLIARSDSGRRHSWTLDNVHKNV